MMRNQGVFGANLLRLLSDEHGRRPSCGRSTGLEGCADGTLRPVVDRTFPLAEAGAAQAHLQSRASVGKIVLATATSSRLLNRSRIGRAIARRSSRLRPDARWCRRGGNPPG